MQELSPAIRDKMKKIFNECYRAVQACEDPTTGRRRWELFKELPDKRVCTLDIDGLLVSMLTRRPQGIP